MKFVRSALAALTIALLACQADAQPVTKAPVGTAPFAGRLTWGLERAGQHDAAWVGYQIRRWSPEDRGSYFGSYSRGRRAPIASVLGLAPADTLRRADGMLGADYALFFRVDRGQADFEELEVRSLESQADFDELPIYWLGFAETAASAEWLIARFGEARTADAREELVEAIGVHRAPAQTLAFLSDVATSTWRDGEVREAAVFWLSQQGTAQVLPLLERLAREDVDEEIRERAVFAIAQVGEVEAMERLTRLIEDTSLPTDTREEAVFWLGQEAGAEALPLLDRLARTDRDEDVREKAVFAISQVDGDAATEALVTLARRAEYADVQETAVFWLGQRASDRIGETIQSIAFDASATALQEKAVFALSQLPGDEGVLHLIEVARTHPNIATRERAIFWLSQSRDRRAEDALVKLARGE